MTHNVLWEHNYLPPFFFVRSSHQTGPISGSSRISYCSSSAIYNAAPQKIIKIPRHPPNCIVRRSMISLPFFLCLTKIPDLFYLPQNIYALQKHTTHTTWRLHVGPPRPLGSPPSNSKTNTPPRATPNNSHRPSQNQSPCHACRHERSRWSKTRSCSHQCRRSRRHRRRWLYARHAA